LVTENACIFRLKVPQSAPYLRGLQRHIVDRLHPMSAERVIIIPTDSSVAKASRPGGLHSARKGGKENTPSTAGLVHNYLSSTVASAQRTMRSPSVQVRERAGGFKAARRSGACVFLGAFLLLPLTCHVCPLSPPPFPPTSLSRLSVFLPVVHLTCQSQITTSLPTSLAPTPRTSPRRASASLSK
jgi:hypothetical protein